MNQILPKVPSEGTLALYGLTIFKPITVITMGHLE